MAWASAAASDLVSSAAGPAELARVLATAARLRPPLEMHAPGIQAVATLVPLTPGTYQARGGVAEGESWRARWLRLTRRA